MMSPNDMWVHNTHYFQRISSNYSKDKKKDFDILEDDYRQNEFLNVSSLSQIKTEFDAIKEIWTSHSKKNEEYTLFKI